MGKAIEVAGIAIRKQTGHYCNNGGFSGPGHTDIGVALDFAKEAVKIAPVYYVTGNHEASLSQYDELKIELKTIGVIVLEDEAVQLKHDTEEITLIGLSDPDFTIKGDVFREVQLWSEQS